MPRSVGAYAEGRSVRLASGLLCADEQAFAITVLEVQGNVVGDPDDDVLWKTSGVEGVETVDVAVGEAPPGWSEDVPLVRQPPGTARLAVQIETSLTVRSSVTFDVSDLREGEVLTADGYMPLEAFGARQPSDCPAT